MPNGGTHLFSVSPTISCSVVSSLTTSRITSLSLSPPVSVKSTFSAFYSDCFTLQGDIKLWNNPFFSVPCLLCYDAPVGDWVFCTCVRARPASNGFLSISLPSTFPAYASASACIAYASMHRPFSRPKCVPDLSSVSVFRCKMWFSVLSEESLYDDALNLGFDQVPVAPRCKRYYISAAGTGSIKHESVNLDKPNLPYEPCTANLNLGDNLLLVKLLSPDTKLPMQGSKSAAGYDLYSSEESILLPKTRKLIDTGIAVSMNTPKNLYARIAPRSGLSVKGLYIGAGVIEADY